MQAPNRGCVPGHTCIRIDTGISFTATARDLQILDRRTYVASPKFIETVEPIRVSVTEAAQLRWMRLSGSRCGRSWREAPGALISTEPGEAVHCALFYLQKRGFYLQKRGVLHPEARAPVRFAQRRNLRGHDPGRHRSRQRPGGRRRRFGCAGGSSIRTSGSRTNGGSTPRRRSRNRAIAGVAHRRRTRDAAIAIFRHPS